MAKQYSKFEHTHVTVNHPNKSDGWSGTHPILLHTGGHVWVAGCYAMDDHPQVAQLAVPNPNPVVAERYDEDGNCIFAVPADWCEFWSAEDAAQIDAAMDADERLLSYAR